MTPTCRSQSSERRRPARAASYVARAAFVVIYSYSHILQARILRPPGPPGGGREDRGTNAPCEIRKLPALPSMPGIQVGLFRRPLHICCSDVTLTAVDPRNYVFSHRRTQLRRWSRRLPAERLPAESFIDCRFSLVEKVFRGRVQTLVQDFFLWPGSSTARAGSWSSAVGRCLVLFNC